MKKSCLDRYCVRYAAGGYWILDISRQGREFQPPVQMNETGAEIFRLAKEGKNKAEIAGLLSKEYEADFRTLCEDIEVFATSLAEKGIFLFQNN